MTIYLANLADSDHLNKLFGVSNRSGLNFFSFFVDLNALRTSEIIEKPLENLGFPMVFICSTKLLPNPKHVVTVCTDSQNGRPGRPNDHPSRQNDSGELPDEAQERQDGSSECFNGCPDGQCQPNLLLKVPLKANLNAPDNLWD